MPLLPPAQLTRHAVCLGMTGSGKTGLCIGLLEDLALHGVPIPAVDPKGDLTNLVPTAEPYAGRVPNPEATAQTWRDGLAAARPVAAATPRCPPGAPTRPPSPASSTPGSPKPRPSAPTRPPTPRMTTCACTAPSSSGSRTTRPTGGTHERPVRL